MHEDEEGDNVEQNHSKLLKKGKKLSMKGQIRAFDNDWRERERETNNKFLEIL